MNYTSWSDVDQFIKVKKKFYTTIILLWSKVSQQWQLTTKNMQI